MFRLLLVIFLAGGVVSADTDSANVVQCDSILGADTLLRSGNVLLLGELHGTNESPKIVSDLVCLSLVRGLDVTVALEIPDIHEDLVNEYLSSEGTVADRNKLNEGNF